MIFSDEVTFFVASSESTVLFKPNEKRKRTRMKIVLQKLVFSKNVNPYSSSKTLTIKTL